MIEITPDEAKSMMAKAQNKANEGRVKEKETELEMEVEEDMIILDDEDEDTYIDDGLEEDERLSGKDLCEDVFFSENEEEEEPTMLDECLNDCQNKDLDLTKFVKDLQETGGFVSPYKEVFDYIGCTDFKGLITCLNEIEGLEKLIQVFYDKKDQTYYAIYICKKKVK